MKTNILRSQIQHSIKAVTAQSTLFPTLVEKFEVTESDLNQLVLTLTVSEDLSICPQQKQRIYQSTKMAWQEQNVIDSAQAQLF